MFVEDCEFGQGQDEFKGFLKYLVEMYKELIIYVQSFVEGFEVDKFRIRSIKGERWVDLSILRDRGDKICEL